MQRLIAVGDIHGQYNLLMDLMGQVRPRREDQLVFLGDYIDRGPGSPQVLDWLIEFKAEYPHTVMLRGNHEQMLLDAFDDVRASQQKSKRLFGKLFTPGKNFIPEAAELFLSNGGLQTLQAYGRRGNAADPLAAFDNIPKAHLFFLRRSKFFYRHGMYLFVHAGVDPEDPKGERSTDAFLWERRPLWVKKPGWNKIVVHGHTPVTEPYFGRWEIALDTGAGHKGCLTACDVLSKEVWQAGPAKI